MTGYHAKIIVGVISYIGLIIIAWMLYRAMPWTPAPGLDKDADLRRDPLTIALRTALVLSVAWLITSMYTLSWYDLLAWMPLAVLAATKLDQIMVIRGATLSVAYVPGRAIDMGSALDFTATRIRDTVSPIIQMAMVLAVILWWRQPDRPELFPFKKSKAPPAASAPRLSESQPATSDAPPPRSSPPQAARSRGGIAHGAGVTASRLISSLSADFVSRLAKEAPTGCEGQLGHTMLIEVEQPSRYGVLGVEIGAEHWRIICVDRHRHAGRDQLPDGMMIKVRHYT